MLKAHKYIFKNDLINNLSMSRSTHQPAKNKISFPAFFALFFKFQKYWAAEGSLVQTHVASSAYIFLC